MAPPETPRSEVGTPGPGSPSTPDGGSMPAGIVKRSVFTFVGLAGTVAALTTMFYSMRAVMEVGGVCASGNTPYTPRVPCPTGVPGLMIGSIFLGLGFLALYAVSAIGPNLTLLAWPALFLSLGWNFLEYGIDPPGPGGVAVGWLICAVVFLAMGGIPLVIGIRALMMGRDTRVPSTVTDRVGKVGPGTGATVTGNLRVYAWALQLVAIAFGMWIGIEIFEWATGSTITFGFG
ncbi:MAG: hypothetical protein MUP67_01215 [Acidimicrobiia bacterium]|nr:hypothetical protein [Acidimicrobiia bacterium]